MAEAFQFELVSPERLLISEAVEEVVVPGSDGDFGVLAHHAPLMSTIRPGFIEVKHTDGSASKIFVQGGFADTGPNGLTILAERAVPAEDLKADVIAAEIKDAEEDLADASDDAARTAAQHKIGQLKEVQAALATL
ncbi:F0F1 ATP synthase subunit epsilon [Breoghania sp. L-A4]|uniref:F0F1 ATP synthase subunit epsilon n=1 Tax=Breoghania sp. L-A4 TaxID=2304600 RepID=UPI000E35DC56|nr:F0F1 ATP synthase subunit epsilon [Breoghania sp. L-A4]AXS39052.1 F0F1 ATP synthase subunit epsilon [Breoghania sp. L-A4]